MDTKPSVDGGEQGISISYRINAARVFTFGHFFFFFG